MSQSEPEVRLQAAPAPDLEPHTRAPFEVTLLELPTLPVSLIRQASDWLQGRRMRSRRPQPEAWPRPADPWYREVAAQVQAFGDAPSTAPLRFNPPSDGSLDLLGDYQPSPYSWANSLLIHLFVLTAMLLPFALRGINSPAPIPKKIFDLTPLVLTLRQLHGKADGTHGGGGGGDRSPLPASRGALPPFARTQFAPPTVTVPKIEPVLPMPATLLGPPELKFPAMKLDMPFGNPLAAVGPPSQGPGTGGGIGPGNGTGVGPGTGPGYGPGSDGGCCQGAYSVGGGVAAPVPIYAPEPAYSEEARKAKFGGIVRLWIVVDARGVVRSVRVAKNLGMGLDEEAVKTVSNWKFRPALR